MAQPAVQAKLPEIKTMIGRTPLVILILLLGDALSFILAFFLAIYIRYAMIPIIGGVLNWEVILPLLYTSLISIIITYALTGLYPGFGKTAVEEMRQIFYSLLLGFGVLGLAIYLQKLAPNFPRSVFVMSWAFACFFNLTIRILIRNRATLLPWWGEPVIIIGRSAEADDVIQRLTRSRRLGMKPILLLDDSVNQQAYIGAQGSEEGFRTEPTNIHGVPIISSQQQMVEIASKYKINHAVYVQPSRGSLGRIQSPPVALLEQPHELDVVPKMKEQSLLDLRGLSKFFPTVDVVLANSDLGSLWVRTIDLEGRLTLQTSYHLLNKRALSLKRSFDLLLGTLLAIIFTPIFLVIAILIKIDSPGPVLYIQERIGKRGKLIKYIKFRTMQNNAEQLLEQLLISQPQARVEYERFHKLAKDPRITRVGKYLRKFSLDELPQLYHVVTGDLSLVGPRAYMLSEFEAMGNYKDLILQVQPGMTGWWQVMGRQTTTFQQRLELDEYYLSNWSLWLDIYIMLKTIWVVIRGVGS